MNVHRSSSPSRSDVRGLPPAVGLSEASTHSDAQCRTLAAQQTVSKLASQAISRGTPPVFDESATKMVNDLRQQIDGKATLEGLSIEKGFAKPIKKYLDVMAPANSKMPLAAFSKNQEAAFSKDADLKNQLTNAVTMAEGDPAILAQQLTELAKDSKGMQKQAANNAATAEKATLERAKNKQDQFSAAIVAVRKHEVKNVAQAADKVLEICKIDTPSAAAELRIGDKVYKDFSRHRTEAEVGALHPDLKNALNDAKQNLPKLPAWHGFCAEVGCVDQALKEGSDITQGYSKAVHVVRNSDNHGKPNPACPSCESMLTSLSVPFE